VTEQALIAVTLGDVAGIGPEVVVRVCCDERLPKSCLPIVVGHPQVLRRAVALVGCDLKVVEVDSPAVGRQAAVGELACWNPAGDDAAHVEPGRIDVAAGQAAYDYLLAAARAALAGEVDAVTTAPLNKAALQLAGHAYPGHTEILAEACGVSKFAMMLYLPAGETVRSPFGLGVAHVTLHTSIASVPQLLNAPVIEEKIALIDGFLRDVGCDAPRIAVCALNPHAGEAGLFGDEELRLIAPAVASQRALGIDVTGPLPADTLFCRAFAGEFDGVAAMYHDQGHIALKLMGLDRAVNITLGLPIVRTSPSHGTAFDIAWQGRASADGMLEALRVAALLANRR
jgi:4-hydroxythreonine-4-phosphate dehydrogenase